MKQNGGSRNKRFTEPASNQVAIFVGFSSVAQSGAMPNAQSSVTLSNAAMARLARFPSFGNTPTTLVLRFTGTLALWAEPEKSKVSSKPWARASAVPRRFPIPPEGPRPSPPGGWKSGYPRSPASPREAPAPKAPSAGCATPPSSPTRRLQFTLKELASRWR